MRKPKPATAGKRIAKSLWFSHNPEKQERDVGRRIDRAIARAVRKERYRCALLVGICEDGNATLKGTREAIEEGVGQ